VLVYNSKSMKASRKPSEGSVKRYVLPDGSKMKPVKVCRVSGPKKYAGDSRSTGQSGKIGALPSSCSACLHVYIPSRAVLLLYVCRPYLFWAVRLYYYVDTCDSPFYRAEIVGGEVCPPFCQLPIP
jgi:hypothetical protein